MDLIDFDLFSCRIERKQDFKCEWDQWQFDDWWLFVEARGENERMGQYGWTNEIFDEEMKRKKTEGKRKEKEKERIENSAASRSADGRWRWRWRWRDVVFIL